MSFMLGVAIFLFIIAAFALVVALRDIWIIRDPIDEEDKKKHTKSLIGAIILIVAILLYNFLFALPTALDWKDLPTTPSGSESNKVKCSWCGKMVNEDDMQGSWCKDCQDDAFGKDGWYN